MKYLKDNVWMVAVFIAIAAFGLIRSIYISEADALWQIKSGQDLLNDGLFTKPDTYSWTIPGREYVSNSWLWNVLIYKIYEISGFLGIAIFTGFMVSSILVLLAYTMRKKNISWFSTFIFTIIIGILSNVWLSARPHIFDYFFIAVAMALLSKIDMSKARGHVITVFTFSIIIILWGNFHLTGLVGAVCLSALYFMKQSELVNINSKEIIAPLVKSLGAFLLFVLCCLATPYGVEGLTKPLITVSASVGIISEWLSPWTFNMFTNTLSAVAIAVIAVILLPAYKSLQWNELLLASGLLAIASWQTRWTPFMVIMLCVVIGKAIDARHSRYSFLDSIYSKTVAIAVVFTIFMVSMATFLPHSRVNDSQYGAALVDSIPADCKIYNEPAIGASIILMRPDLKVSLDGRNDLYGTQEYIEQNTVAYNSEYASEWLDKNAIECVLLHEERPLNQWLSENPEWKLVEEDIRGAKLWTRVL